MKLQELLESKWLSREHKAYEANELDKWKDDARMMGFTVKQNQGRWEAHNEHVHPDAPHPEKTFIGVFTPGSGGELVFDTRHLHPSRIDDPTWTPQKPPKEEDKGKWSDQWVIMVKNQRDQHERWEPMRNFEGKPKKFKNKSEAQTYLDKVRDKFKGHDVKVDHGMIKEGD